MSKHNVTNQANNQLAFNRNASERSPFNVAARPASKAARKRKQERNKANRAVRAALYNEFQSANKWNNASAFHTGIVALSGGTA
jgi:hypothetical protein